MIGLLAVVAIVGVVVYQDHQSKGAIESPAADRAHAKRMAVARDLDSKLKTRHNVSVERGTVLAITGRCDADEIAAIEEQRVMSLLREAGFTSVECGSQQIPVR